MRGLDGRQPGCQPEMFRRCSKRSDPFIRNSTYLQPNTKLTHAIKSKLIPVTKRRFRVDSHWNICRHMKPKDTVPSSKSLYINIPLM